MGRLPLLQFRMPMVLDRVVRAAWEETSDGDPLVSELSMKPEDLLVFFGGERQVAHLRRELIAPPQATRLAQSAGDHAAYQRPVLRAEFRD